MTEKMNDGWIEWHGGDCPVKGMPVGSVELKFRNGITVIPHIESYFYDDDLWSYQSSPFVVDIIAYRIIADQEARPTEKQIADTVLAMTSHMKSPMTKTRARPIYCYKACKGISDSELIDVVSSGETLLMRLNEAMTSGNNTPDRHELQKDGKHPAPCAKFCESNAYESQIRRLNNEASRLAEEINQQAIKMASVESRRDELLAENARMNAIINTPQADDFLRAVSTEAEHQRQRWGSEHDAGKAPSDWFWLIGYLAGKALHAHAAGNTEKAEHHIITTAAACANWHLSMFGKTDMRPGTDQGGAS